MKLAFRISLIGLRDKMNDQEWTMYINELFFLLNEYRPQKGLVFRDKTHKEDWKVYIYCKSQLLLSSITEQGNTPEAFINQCHQRPCN